VPLTDAIQYVMCHTFPRIFLHQRGNPYLFDTSVLFFEPELFDCPTRSRPSPLHFPIAGGLFKFVLAIRSLETRGDRRLLKSVMHTLWISGLVRVDVLVRATRARCRKYSIGRTVREARAREERLGGTTRIGHKECFRGSEYRRGGW